MSNEPADGSKPPGQPSLSSLWKQRKPLAAARDVRASSDGKSDGAAEGDGANGANGHDPSGAANGANGAHAADGTNGHHPANGANGHHPANGSNGANGHHPANGANGSNGTHPANGANGHHPANGFSGTNGHHPANGSNGTNGHHPANGANGSNGTHPANGANGHHPANGSNGANGYHPANGANGSNGTNGHHPANGANGSNGTHAANGANGHHPANGSNGTNGHHPANGANGSNGTHAANGANGHHPANGSNGTNGYHPANGANGFNGTHAANGANGHHPANGSNGANRHHPANGANGSNGTTGHHPANGANGSNGVHPANGSNGTHANGANGHHPAHGTNGQQPAKGANGTIGAQVAPGTNGHSPANGGAGALAGALRTPSTPPGSAETRAGNGRSSPSGRETSADLASLLNLNRSPNGAGGAVKPRRGEQDGAGVLQARAPGPAAGRGRTVREPAPVAETSVLTMPRRKVQGPEAFGGFGPMALEVDAPSRPASAERPGVKTHVGYVALPNRSGAAAMFGVIWFCLAFAAPVVLGAVYVGLIASKQYVVDMRFTVREPLPDSRVQSATTNQDVALLGREVPTVTNTGSVDTLGNYTAVDYAISAQAARDLDERIDLKTIYAKSGADPFSRYGGSPQIERLAKYWRRMVWSNYDPATGLAEIKVRAFRPQDAYTIATNLMELTQNTVNDTARQSRKDSLQFIQKEVDRAQQQMTAVDDQITALRNKIHLINPSSDAEAGNNTLNTNLRTALSQEQAQLAYLLTRLPSPDAPQILRQRTEIEATQKQLAATEARITNEMSGNANLTAAVTEYEKLSTERAAAQGTLYQALGQLQQATLNVDAERSYIASYVKPELPQGSVYPDRLQTILLIVLVSGLIWLLGTLLGKSIMDHVR